MQSNLQGGGNDQEASCWPEIQIPPGRSLKDKPHTQKKEKKKDRKKTKTQLQENQPSQQPDTVRNSAAPLCCQGTVQIPRLPCCGPATPRRPCGRDEGGGWEGSTLMRSWFPTTPPPLMSLSILIASLLPEAWVLFLG